MKGIETEWQEGWRNYAIDHYRIHLAFDLPARAVLGDAEITLWMLVSSMGIRLDAFYLEVESVSGDDTALDFENKEDHLLVHFGQTLVAEQKITLKIKYRAVPKAGMYFEEKHGDPNVVYICTLGEGGLHPNWLPMSSDLALKYGTEVLLRLPNHLTGVSNGRLIETLREENHSTWHWRQDKAHAQYLITVNVGDFEHTALEPALGNIPVNLWMPKGKTELGKYTFRNTTRMINFFSSLFNYPYAWDKYDHCIQPNFPTYGGMEHTSITAFSLYALRGPNDALDGEGPLFDQYHSIWTLETGIAHELVHQWFGNLVTCRSLEHIWLNEGFATYLMYLWEERELGADQFAFNMEYLRESYVGYTKQNSTRALQYAGFETPGNAFEVFHAYYKAALVVHMLHSMLGTDTFRRAITHYLTKNAFKPVTGTDLQHAFEEASGLNLGQFFHQWVRLPGHPVLNISYVFRESRNLIDLSVVQTHVNERKDNIFIFPLKVSIWTYGSNRIEQIWVKNETEHFSIRCDSRPDFISVDPENALLAEIVFTKKRSELLLQLQHDTVVGMARAIRDLAQDFGYHKDTYLIFKEMLVGQTHWTLQGEIASKLWHLPSSYGTELVDISLKSTEYRVRKAAVLSLAHMGEQVAFDRLMTAISHDAHDNVVGAAIFALAKSEIEMPLSFYEKQLNRESWFDTIRLASLRAISVNPRAELRALVSKYCSAPFSYWVIESALLAWEACAPNDPKLHEILMDHAEKSPPLQAASIEILERIAPSEAEDCLKRLAQRKGNSNISVLAKKALETLTRLAVEANLA